MPNFFLSPCSNGAQTWKYLKCVVFYVHKTPEIKYWKIRCEFSFFSVLFLTTKQWVQSKFRESKLKHFFIIRRVITTEFINYGFDRVASMLMQHIIGQSEGFFFPFGRRKEKKKKKTRVLPGTSGWSWATEFCKRIVLYFSILRFASMCFNFTKWKVYVICKLLSKSWLRESYMRTNIIWNVEKPQNGTGKVLYSNSTALNGITILFGHFYPQSFPEKEMIQFPATNGRLHTCAFP